jgi:hypothetical protein
MEFVEKERDNVFAFCCIYDIKTKKKPSRAFQNAYPACIVSTVTPETIFGFTGTSDM